MLVQNIKISADAMVFTGRGNDMRLLLIRRGHDPYKGMWAIPGGFVEDDEDLEPAAIRELQEETGLVVNRMTQLYTIGTPGRDTRGRTVSVIYYTFIDDAREVQGSDDAAEAKWLYVKDITELAFDHMDVLQYALANMKIPH